MASAFGLARRAADLIWASALVRRPLKRGPRHRLDGDLVVTLTSYPQRFPTLHLTLRSLLNQSVSPDHLVLWIAHDAIAQLPRKVLDLKAHGLTIRGCEDIRSFTKIIPALEQFPDAYLVTADDDIFYRPRWLAALVDAALESPGAIVGHRVQLPLYAGDRLRPVRDWNLNVCVPEARIPSPNYIALGVEGVLYPPRSLHPDVVDRATFLALCPTCDDTWLAWMARRQGTLVRRTATPRLRTIAWRGTHTGSLWEENSAKTEGDSEQDRIFDRLSQRFGSLTAL